MSSNSGTPEVTVEAIKQAVRDRGAAALDEPATQARLRACDYQTLAAIDQWLIKRGTAQ